MAIDEPRIRGLKAVEESRIARQRALVLGRVQLQGDASRFWLWTFVIFIAFGIIYWRWAESALESQKSAVMSKQRAVSQVLEPRLVPFRDRVERWTEQLGKGPWKGDRFAASVEMRALTESPGVYLRIRQADAEVGKIAPAAQRSLHDGFTSCLFVRKEKLSPSEGKACVSPSDCAQGELCNEWNVCSPPTQPYNMRLAYRALRVLSTDWTDELHRAPNDIAVRVFERDLEKVSHEDVPIAIDLMTRAKYATVVIDEDPEGGLEPPAKDEEPPETEHQKLARVPHFARIGIWNVERDEPLVFLRTRADAKIVSVGKNAAAAPEIERARQRQANSCALAVAVREELASREPGAAPAGTAPVEGSSDATSPVPPAGSAPPGTGAAQPSAGATPTPAGSASASP